MSLQTRPSASAVQDGHGASAYVGQSPPGRAMFPRNRRGYRAQIQTVGRNMSPYHYILPNLLSTFFVCLASINPPHMIMSLSVCLSRVSTRLYYTRLTVKGPEKALESGIGQSPRLPFPKRTTFESVLASKRSSSSPDV